MSPPASFKTPIGGVSTFTAKPNAFSYDWLSLTMNAPGSLSRKRYVA